jgi:hypothetical protein
LENLYFNHSNYAPQQVLIEDLTIETIRMFGTDVVYIPRQYINRDTLFGENIVSKFENKYLIEMYLESNDTWGGQGEFLSKFGIRQRDTSNFVVSRRRFQEVCWDIARPFEGDLIYFPPSKGFFEIMFVEHEKPFYNLGNLHTYNLSCELFEYDNEEFNTGYKVIDRVQEKYNNTAAVESADNLTIQTETDTIVAFDEKNPFGKF